MARMDPEVLSRVADALVAERGIHLSAGERRELLRIAQGLSCKGSAAETGVCYETVRARRKRVYHKLALGGAGEVISALLGVSLAMLSRELEASAEAYGPSTGASLGAASTRGGLAAPTLS